MTAKEKLLELLPNLSEPQAERALRAIESEATPGDRYVDEWGDLDEFTARASSAALRRLDKAEAEAGFSWDEDPKS